MPLQFREPSYVMVDGRKLAYEVLSPAAPEGTILLITGLAAKRQGWCRQLPVFGQRYRTIIFDQFRALARRKPRGFNPGG